MRSSLRFSPRRIASGWTSFALLALLFAACTSDPELLSQDARGGGDGDSGDGDTGGDGDNGGPGIDLGGARGDGDGNGGDGDSGSGVGANNSCAESDEKADLVPSNLLFVVDKSGSMECNPPEGDGNTPASCDLPQKDFPNLPSKWEITRDALMRLGDDSLSPGALRSLKGKSGLSAGLITFPVDDFCGVLATGEVTTPIAALNGAQLTALDDGFNVSPDGETPLAGAAIRGLELLRQQIVAGEIEGNSYLILMTDGAETCQQAAIDDLLAFVPEALEGFGIRTFVIGAPGSEQARSLLSEIAYLGGTAQSDGCKHGSKKDDVGDCHYDMTESTNFADDLSTAFSAITAQTELTCEFDVPQNALVDLNKVNVVFTPSDGPTESIVQDADRNCETKAEGWQFTSDNKQIVLCGDICDRVRADKNGRVEVVFGCRETIVR